MSHITLQEMGQKACQAKYLLQKLSTEEKNRALMEAAKALRDQSNKILKANEKDLEAAMRSGMHPGLVDRLRLTKSRVEAMAP